MQDGANGEAAARSTRPRQSNLASNLFALAAVGFGVLAVILYLRNPGGGIAPVPTAAPGGNQIVNVTDALRAQGLDVQQPRGLFVPRGVLEVPGQGIEIDGAPAFIFLYPDAAAARAAAEGVDPNDVVPERLAGTPQPDGLSRLTQGSNVIVVAVGGSEETWLKVETAVASLA